MADGIEVVAEAGTSDDVIQAAAEHQPDVVMMDLRMPGAAGMEATGAAGIEATRTIVQASPHIAVLVLTMADDSDTVFAAIRAGARGYLLKESGQAELARAVHAVASGEFITSPGVARRVLTFFAGVSSERPPAPFPELTEREREILDLIAQGKNNPSIATQLFLSPKTVRNHISNIFAKLQVADRAEAIVRAREAGLGRPPSTPTTPLRRHDSGATTRGL